MARSLLSRPCRLVRQKSVFSTQLSGVGALATQLTTALQEKHLAGEGEPLTFSQNQSWGAECSTEQGTR